MGRKGGSWLVAPPPSPPSPHPTVNEWVCHAANNLHSSCLISVGPLPPPSPLPSPSFSSSSSTASMRKSRSRGSRSNGGSGENWRKTGLLLDLGQQAVEGDGTLSPIFLTSLLFCCQRCLSKDFFFFNCYYFLLLLLPPHPPTHFPFSKSRLKN